VAQTTAKPKLPAGPYVQVGVFTHPANAAELKARLEAQGIPVVIATRVQVGPFKSRKEAEEMREKLKAMGLASIVINQ
jgi:cell division protein FtsN